MLAVVDLWAEVETRRRAGAWPLAGPGGMADQPAALMDAFRLLGGWFSNADS